MGPPPLRANFAYRGGHIFKGFEVLTLTISDPSGCCCQCPAESRQVPPKFRHRNRKPARPDVTADQVPILRVSVSDRTFSDIFLSVRLWTKYHPKISDKYSSDNYLCQNSWIELYQKATKVIVFHVYIGILDHYEDLFVNYGLTRVD
jgi:hypothetical protein